jgi:methylmalonyl-CoA mutase
MIFDEFPVPTFLSWKNAVEKEMGKDSFSKKLIWETYEDLVIQPLHIRSNNDGNAAFGSLPGFAPYTRGRDFTGNKEKPVFIAQSLTKRDPKQANRELKEYLNAGQNSIFLNMEYGEPDSTAERDAISRNVDIRSVEDMSLLLNGVQLDSIPVIIAGVCQRQSITNMSSYLKKIGLSNAKVSGRIEHDPFSDIIASGKDPLSKEVIFEEIAEFMKYGHEELPNMRNLQLSSHSFHNAGASTAQELAFTLCLGIETLRNIQHHLISLEDAASSIIFSFSVGTNFYVEIAKLRSARLLWSKITHHFGLQDKESMAMDMNVRPSWWNKTLYDPDVNILRNTIENMIALLGGAQSFTQVPHDEVSGKTNERSGRLARNTHSILTMESRLSEVMDPVAGSYFFEYITDALARKSWEIVQSVEAAGGLLSALQKGVIQAMTAEVAGKKRKNISFRKEVFIGINKYPNLQERISDIPDFQVHAGSESTRENTVKVLRKERGVEALERIRSEVDKLNERPRVFLAPYGPAFWSRARAAFSSAFFGIAGFTILDNPGFESPEAAIDAALEACADVVVACSDDEGYSSSVPIILERMRKRNSKMLCIVAGYPKDSVESLQKAGVDEFIHLKTDTEEVLSGICMRLGILDAERGKR